MVMTTHIIPVQRPCCFECQHVFNDTRGQQMRDGWTRTEASCDRDCANLCPSRLALPSNLLVCLLCSVGLRPDYNMQQRRFISDRCRDRLG